MKEDLPDRNAVLKLLKNAGARKKNRTFLYSRKMYSAYDAIIKHLRFQLKYMNRHLKKVQKIFHSAEGKLHKAFMSRCKNSDRMAVSEEEMDILRQKADYAMEAFCNMFKLQQKLLNDLDDAVSTDAEGKATLANLPLNVKH